ncbi:MAG: DinB family protein [Planctomycetota bacterium]|jgi:uncharacterized damage-inducible protein DinB
MNLIENWKEALIGAFDGRNWYGPPLKSILEGIDAEEAAREILPGIASIWKLVNHITGWMREAERALSGKPLSPPQEWDWKEIESTSQEAWTSALGDLVSTHHQLLEALGNFPEDRLQEEVTDGKGTSLGFRFDLMLNGIIQHNVYHSAQIMLMKRHGKGPAK